MTSPFPFLSEDEPARIWRRSARRRFASAPGRHAELVVLAGLSGQATYFVDGVTVQLRAQMVLLCWPGQAHFLVSDTPDFDMVVAVVSPAIMHETAAHPPRNRPGGTAAQLRRLQASGFQEIVRLSDQLISAPSDVIGIGTGWWLHRLWTLSSQPVSGDLPSVHPKVAAATEILYADPGVALGTLARQVGLTPTRIGQLFKAQTGMALRDFRTERRFEKFEAIRESNPHSSLLGAALDAGFGDYSSFYRAYRRRYGTAPAAIGRAESEQTRQCARKNCTQNFPKDKYGVDSPIEKK